MTATLVLAVVGALLVIAVGLQVTANQIQKFPVDTRNAGTLVDTIRRNALAVRPAEFDRLTSIVEESLSSEAVARSKLVPLIEELKRQAPTPASTVSGPTRRGRRSRARWLADELSELEERWDTRSPHAQQ